MAYIGRGTDKISNIEKLDVITFDGSSSYTLQKNSVNFTPNSANSLQVSIDGVVQAGNFTVSGSTIDFGVAVPATSTCDFIFHYGTGLITTPADGTVGLAQLSATGTKDATTFLRGDNTFAEAGGGKVLQVVTATDETERSTTSTTFTDITGLSVAITPSATSSKVLVMCTTTGYSGNTVAASEYTLIRGSTNIGASGSGEIVRLYGANDIQSSITMIVLDSPSTTSATTYKAQMRRNSASGSAYAQAGNSLGTITVMEIGA